MSKSMKELFEGANWPPNERALIPSECCSMAADVEAFEVQAKCVDLALKFLPRLAEAVEEERRVAFAIGYAHDNDDPAEIERLEKMADAAWETTQEVLAELRSELEGMGK